MNFESFGLKKYYYLYFIKNMNIIPAYEKNIFFQFMETHLRIPLVREKFLDFDIGKWYNIKKKMINSTTDKLYQELNINDIVKKNLDKYLEQSVAKNSNQILLTPEEAKSLTLKFAEEKLPDFIEMQKIALMNHCITTEQERTEILLQFLEENLDFRDLINH